MIHINFKEIFLLQSPPLELFGSEDMQGVIPEADEGGGDAVKHSIRVYQPFKGAAGQHSTSQVYKVSRLFE